MVCVTVLLLLHWSVTVYVLMIVMGQVPVGVPSLLDTERFASEVQLSLIVTPIASSSATVVLAAGLSLAEQPSTFSVCKAPVIDGASTSFTVTVSVTVSEVQPCPSVTNSETV